MPTGVSASESNRERRGLCIPSNSRSSELRPEYTVPVSVTLFFSLNRHFDRNRTRPHVLPFSLNIGHALTSTSDFSFPNLSSSQADSLSHRPYGILPSYVCNDFEYAFIINNNSPYLPSAETNRRQSQEKPRYLESARGLSAMKRIYRHEPWFARNRGARVQH